MITVPLRAQRLKSISQLTHLRPSRFLHTVSYRPSAQQEWMSEVEQCPRNCTPRFSSDYVSPSFFIPSNLCLKIYPIDLVPTQSCTGSAIEHIFSYLVRLLRLNRHRHRPITPNLHSFNIFFPFSFTRTSTVHCNPSKDMQLAHMQIGHLQNDLRPSTTVVVYLRATRNPLPSRGTGRGGGG